MPSYREIMEITGLRSTNAVWKLIRRLEQERVLERDRKGRLIPRRLFGELPFLGVVEAGFPSPAEEELVDTMSLDEYLIGNREASYILKVKGDSMVEAGIRPGDLLIVDRSASPRDGDIVIAEVDGEWTMKYYRSRGGRIHLEAGNKRYKPIMPHESLKVAAVVKAVVRKY